jgi:uncharacterized membrane protein
MKSLKEFITIGLALMVAVSVMSSPLWYPVLVIILAARALQIMGVL